MLVMLSRSLFFLTIFAAASMAQTVKGFNYGSVRQSTTTYTTLFNNAKHLNGTAGFTSARLFTMIQDGTTNDPIEAIPAAIDTGTTLLLGLWASAGEAAFGNELAALDSAIRRYGSQLQAVTVAISVGSEDLYRITPTGIANNAGVGVGPDLLVQYIQQVRSAIAGTILERVPIGHVDTWTGWVNSSNSGVIDASDFLGMDAYPYYQYQQDNNISNAASIFEDAYQATNLVAKGRPVWVTETGWPTTGPTEGKAEANVQNAEKYWKAVGCKIFDTTNVWWFDLQGSDFSVDASGDPETPSYDLSCSSGALSRSHTQTTLSTTPTFISSSLKTTFSSKEIPTSATMSTTSASPLASLSTPCSTCTNFVGISSAITLVTAITTADCTSSTSISIKGHDNASLSVLPYATHAIVATPSAIQYPSSTLLTSTKVTKLPKSTPYRPQTSAVPTTRCGSTLMPTFEFPHLIIHLNSSRPDAQPGPSYYGWVYPDTSSGFNFDINLGDKEKTCSLIFLLPELHDLKTSTYAFEGRGGLKITKLNGPLIEESTFATVAAAGEITYGAIDNIKPGNSYVIHSVPCREFAGQRIAFRVSTDDDMQLNWFEDCNAPALGLFMNICELNT